MPTQARHYAKAVTREAKRRFPQLSRNRRRSPSPDPQISQPRLRHAGVAKVEYACIDLDEYLGIMKNIGKERVANCALFGMSSSTADIFDDEHGEVRLEALEPTGQLGAHSARNT
jgi:hypothetical protein